MGKLGYTYFIICLAVLNTYAQTSFNLEMERQVKDSLLVLDLYIKKNSGADFALGTSNFDFKVNSPNVDLSKARFLPGEFDASSAPASYESMGTGSNNLLVMNVRANVSGNGTGKLVSTQKLKVGTVEIPINNPCATATPEWVTGRAAIYPYSKSAFGTEITKDAVYVTPTSIELDGGVSKTIPTVAFENGKLKSSSASNNQWYLDGAIIPGATTQEITPIVQGRYSVEVTYPCARNMSPVMPITVTGLADFAMSYSFGAQPNPFIGEAMITYTLSNSSLIKLQLYDLSGTHLFDLESGTKSQGKHEFVFKPNAYHLAAGTYIAKLTVGDKMGVLKLVATK